MNYNEKIDQKMIAATKSRDKIVLSALRMMKTALHNREIDVKRQLTDAEFMQVLSSMVKQRNDSIDQFRLGGRTDLVEKEEAELKVVLEFLPVQLTEQEMIEEIDRAIGDVGAVTVKDMGKVMKVLMPKLTGRVDGKALGEMVKAKLSA
jgi:uncharacterized protein YqeY